MQRSRARSVVAQAASQAPYSRRGAVAGLVLPALLWQPISEARAEEAASSSALVDTENSQEAVKEISEPSWRSYIAREFSFSYPPSLQIIDDGIYQDDPFSAPRSTMGACTRHA